MSDNVTWSLFQRHDAQQQEAYLPSFDLFWHRAAWEQYSFF